MTPDQIAELERLYSEAVQTGREIESEELEDALVIAFPAILSDLKRLRALEGAMEQATNNNDVIAADWFKKRAAQLEKESKR
jgi:hypothetical protein